MPFLVLDHSEGMLLVVGLDVETGETFARQEELG